MFKIENHYNLKGMVAIITGAGSGGREKFLELTPELEQVGFYAYF